MGCCISIAVDCGHDTKLEQGYQCLPFLAFLEYVGVCWRNGTTLHRLWSAWSATVVLRLFLLRKRMTAKVRGIVQRARDALLGGPNGTFDEGFEGDDDRVERMGCRPIGVIRCRSSLRSARTVLENTILTAVFTRALTVIPTGTVTVIVLGQGPNRQGTG